MSAETSQWTTVELAVSGGVATFELVGPRVLNALHSSTHQRLQHLVRETEDHEDIRAIVLCGAGRSFCSGSDLREVGQLQGDAARRYVALDFATKNILAASSRPVIAAIQGHCVGGGLELALACDIRIATDDAVFAMPEVALGSLPGSGGLQRLPAVVGRGVAADWILTGRSVDAQEALAHGLVTRVVPAGEVREQAAAIARRMAATNPEALRLAKIALTPEPPSDRGLTAAFQSLAGAACHASEEYRNATERFTQ